MRANTTDADDMMNRILKGKLSELKVFAEEHKINYPEGLSHGELRLYLRKWLYRSGTEDQEINFGRHRGKTFLQAFQQDEQYFQWALTEVKTKPTAGWQLAQLVTWAVLAEHLELGDLPMEARKCASGGPEHRPRPVCPKGGCDCVKEQERQLLIQGPWISPGGLDEGDDGHHEADGRGDQCLEGVPGLQHNRAEAPASRVGLDSVASPAKGLAEPRPMRGEQSSSRVCGVLTSGECCMLSEALGDFVYNQCNALRDSSQLFLMELACSKESVLSAEVERQGLRAARCSVWNGFDLATVAGVKKSLRFLLDERPEHLWVATECTAFSPMQNLNQRDHAQKERLAAKRREQRLQHVGAMIVTRFAHALGVTVHWEWSRRCRAWKWKQVEEFRQTCGTHTRL